jgi:hypothetical protein
VSDSEGVKVGEGEEELQGDGLGKEGEGLVG